MSNYNLLDFNKIIFSGTQLYMSKEMLYNDLLSEALDK